MERAGIGAQVAAARSQRAWSRETLAHHSGVSWSAIAQIESGRRRDVRIGTLFALADALGVDAATLVRGHTEPRALFEHRLLPYASAEELVEEAVPFLVEGLARTDSVLVVTTAANSDLLRRSLGTEARRVTFADAADWYRSPKHALTAFREYVAARCYAGAPWMYVLGEPVWSGRTAAELKAWVSYEAVVNLTLAWAPATVVCPYDTTSAPSGVLADARRAHPVVQGSGGVAASPEYRVPEHFLLEIGAERSPDVPPARS